MALDNIQSNAPEDMRPYIIVLETMIKSHEESIKAMKTQIAALSKRP